MPLTPMQTLARRWFIERRATIARRLEKHTRIESDARKNEIAALLNEELVIDATIDLYDLEDARPCPTK